MDDGASRWAGRLAGAAMLAGIALLAGACGGGGSHPASGTRPGPGSVQQMDVFARCMRSHGEPGFYFANPNSVSSATSVLTFRGFVVPGMNPQTPQFATAMAACKHLLPGGPPPPMTQAQKDRLLKFAACIRAHGYPSYPDPVFQNGGVFEQQQSGIDQNSPRFQAAVKACNAKS
jgi:hypothetical protein